MKTERRVLPDRRKNYTVKTYSHQQKPVYITIGEFEDGTPAEVFVRYGKSGGNAYATTCAWCMMISLALQHGVTVDHVVNSHKDFIEGDETGVMTAVIDELRKYCEAEVQP